VGTYIGIPALKALGIKKVDALLVSHTDSDHISGVSELLEGAKDEGIKIEALVMTDNSLSQDPGKKLYDLAEEKGVKVYRAGAGDEIRTGDMRLSVLWPQKGMKGEPNEMSMVCALYCNNMSVLLTGDVEGEGEKHITEALKGKHFLLYKAAHHGSKNSNSSELLRQIHPALTLISCGENNRYGHPHREALQRIRETESLIFVTASQGAIAVHSDGNETEVEFTGKDRGEYEEKTDNDK
jgi:competence protein ComEC